jgi:branched-chain amino acid transport system substrate-binding protein
VVAVIGHLQSYVSVPAAAIYDLSGLVMLSPTATDPELTSQGYRRVFRATFTDRTVGRQMADFAASRGHRQVAIYYIRNRYGRGLANAFEERASELGVSVAARQSYDPSEQANERTFAPTLREWKEVDIDAVFLAGEVPSAARFITEARRQGITAPIYGGDAMSSPALIGVAGAAAEGTIVASVFHPDEPRAEVQRFTAAFRQRFGASPDAGSALGYDAVRLLAHAMREAGSTVPDEVARALHAVNGWQGITGAFSFDANGDLADKPLVKMVVRGGRFDYVPEQALTASR